MTHSSYKLALTSCVLLSSSVLGTSALAADELFYRPVPKLPTSEEQTVAKLDSQLTMYLGGELEGKYLDNINRANSGEKDDFITVITPMMAIRSDWEKHSLLYSAEISKGLYKGYDDNDFLDADNRIKGHYDLSETDKISGYGRFRLGHVSIGDFDDDADVRLSEPTTYRLGQVGAEFERLTEERTFKAGLEGRLYNYDNIDRRGTGRSINDDRDRRETELWIRPGYYVKPETMLYVEARHNSRIYDEQIDSTATYKRDSQGYQLLVGSELGDRKGTEWIDVNIGYLDQSFYANFYGDVKTFVVNGNGFWKYSPFLRFSTQFERSLQESTLAGSSSYLRNRIKVGAKYLIDTGWELDYAGRYTHNDFNINPASGRRGRRDDVYDVKLGLTHEINKNLAVKGEVMHYTRRSTTGTAKYDANSFMIKLIAGNF